MSKKRWMTIMQPKRAAWRQWSIDRIIWSTSIVRRYFSWSTRPYEVQIFRHWVDYKVYPNFKWVNFTQVQLFVHEKLANFRISYIKLNNLKHPCQICATQVMHGPTYQFVWLIGESMRCCKFVKHKSCINEKLILKVVLVLR